MSAKTGANLRLIALGIAHYGNTHGAYPPDLDTLVATAEITPALLVSTFDRTPASFVATETLRNRSSFAYHPGPRAPVSDPVLMIAFERTAWGSNGPRWFIPWAQWVLFGDGHVVLLDDKGFDSALRRDAERRRELGWPVPAAP